MKTALRIFLFAVIFLFNSVFAENDVPYLTGRVTDNAQILSQETCRLLAESLKGSVAK